MHMIPIDGPGIDLHFCASGDLTQQLAAPKGNVANKDRITVFGGPYEMVFAIPDCVTSMFVICHTSVLPYPSPKGEGFTDPLSGTLNFRILTALEIEEHDHYQESAVTLLNFIGWYCRIIRTCNK